MKSDITRILLIVCPLLVAGIFSGHFFLFGALGLAVIIIWYYRALIGFLNFIRYGAEDNLDDLPGVVNELVREFETVRNQYMQRESKLSSFLTRFEETTSALPDAVVATDGDGKIEWANRKAGEYLGVQWPKDTGQRLSNLIRYPDLLNYILKEQEQAQTRPLELVSPANPELRLEIRVNHYGASSMLIVARDITEIHRINRVRKDFIANASHELRTPLTVIGGYLEAFDEDKENCPEEWRSQIAQMREQAARMQRLIEDLLKLSSLESATEKTPDEEINVAEMLSSILREAETVSGEHQHTFSREVDPLLFLHGNHRDLYSAFSNIIFNAVQYTPARGEVVVHWFQDEEGAHLSVRDTGEGIEETHLQRITERFYRVDKGRSRSKGGTGLGLAIVKHVLSNHNAKLEIRSTPGEGSEFICRFPKNRIISRHKEQAQVSATA